MLSREGNSPNKTEGPEGPKSPKGGPRGLRGMARSHGPSLQYSQPSTELPHVHYFLLANCLATTTIWLHARGVGWGVVVMVTLGGKVGGRLVGLGIWFGAQRIDGNKPQRKQKTLNKTKKQMERTVDGCLGHDEKQRAFYRRETNSKWRRRILRPFSFCTQNFLLRIPVW